MRLTTLALTLGLVLSSPPAGAVTVQVPFSGQLTESGEPLDGTFLFTFNFYDQLTDGNFFGAVQESIHVENGIFHAELDITSDLFGSGDLFVGIVKEGDPELVPRVRVTYVPKSVFSLKSSFAAAAQSAAYADVAGSVVGGSPHAVGLNFKGTASTQNLTSVTPMDSVKIGVPAAGWVLVEFTGRVGPITVTQEGASFTTRLGVSNVRSQPNASVFLQDIGFVNTANANNGDIGAVFCVRGCFQVTGTIEDSFHTFYLYRLSTNLGYQNGFATATWYPVRYDQPEQ